MPKKRKLEGNNESNITKKKREDFSTQKIKVYFYKIYPPWSPYYGLPPYSA